MSLKNYKFIVNPVAGAGKANSLLPRIKEIMKESGVDYDIYETRKPRDAIESARIAAKEGYDIVVAVGGDGTVNEVLNGIVGTKATLAVIHGGKGNDFATAVNMPTEVNSACKALLDANIRSIDLGKVMDRYFINSVGIGFDAAVAERVNMGVKPFKGVSAYIYAVLEMLITYQTTDMEVDLGDGVFTCHPTLVAVGIGQAYGGGMRILPDAIQDDGLFDVCILDKMKKPLMLYHFPKVFKGKLKNLEESKMFRTTEIKIKLSDARPMHLEGEILRGDYMHFTIEEKAMPVIFGPG